MLYLELSTPLASPTPEKDCEEMAAIATRLGLPVKADINGILVTAYVNDDGKKLAGAWSKANQRGADYAEANDS